MTCAICGWFLIGVDVTGTWVWVHAGGPADHRPQPVIGARP